MIPAPCLLALAPPATDAERVEDGFQPLQPSVEVAAAHVVRYEYGPENFLGLVQLDCTLILLRCNG